MKPGSQLSTALACAALTSLFALQGCSSGESTQANDPPTSPPPTTPPPEPPPPAMVSGLDARPANTSCLAWERPSAGSELSLTRFTNLNFSSPIALMQAPNSSSRWYVVEQGGVVRRFDGDSPTSASVFVDIVGRVRSGGEMGLLGMAFHPDFPTDNRVFLSYTASAGGRLESRISSFVSNDQGLTLDPNSEVRVLTVDQPESNHNGGHIAFGPDGFLYIGFGDGGSGGDPHGNPGNGQRLTTLLGKLLRIDVNTASGYAIPTSNPFAQNTVCPTAGRSSGECPEIYAWGFRNPWRWNFDRENGDLWLADVGQGQWEEVNQVTLGGNYGWRCREGAHDFNSGGTTGCSSATLIDPVTEYDHSEGFSITGGYVYRGSQNTNLFGRYLFGDFGTGRIWAWIPQNAGSTREPTLLLESGRGISSFGQGNDGELYVVDHGGTLHRIVFEASSGGGGAPELLSATGCVNPVDPTQPASGLIPYDINAPFWSDGVEKDRWLALPDGEQITVEADGDWEFPERSVLMKNFLVGAQLIETRLFMRHPDGAWGGFTYEWNAQQTDATLVQGGATRDIGAAQPWIFPSEAQCLECHTSATGRVLGPETAQLNRDLSYPSTGRTANELFTLSHIGVLAPAINDPASRPALADPMDASADLTARARAYLHTNCSQCHRPEGPTPSMDLRSTTALSATGACDVAPQLGDLGIGANARLIAPGSAANSVIVNRMDRRGDEHAMPPLASNQVDAAGVALITEWIDGLSGC